MRIFQFVAAAVIVSLFMPGPLAAQGTVATYSKEAMDDLVILLSKAAKEGYAMQAKQTTIFGGWLPKGKKQGNEPWVPILVLKNLDPGKSYRVIAAGDNDAKDLDLRIADPEGNVIVTDSTTLRDAEVTFRPTRRQDYVIQLRLYDSNDNCVCIGAILAK